MGDYRMIALDMDGTALTGDKRFLAQTARDIAAAAEQGRTVALCTGRCVPELAPYREQLAGVRYAVTVSGAVIYDLWERKTLYAVGMERELAMHIAAVGQAHNGMVHLLSEEASVVRTDQASRTADYGMGPYQELFTTVSRHADDIVQAAGARPFMPKINIYFGSAPDRAAAYEVLRELPVTVIRAENFGLEMTPPGVTKGVGLRRLADMLGVDMREVIAVGDGENDLPMLEAAGLAVAMGNAVPAVRAMADVAVADNDHNGVGEAIRRFLL